MTAPRTALFQRKGAPALSSAPPGPAIGGPPEASEGEPSTVQCQGCGATIDTQTGEVVAPPPDASSAPAGPDAGGADIGAKLQQMMGTGS